MTDGVYLASHAAQTVLNHSNQHFNKSFNMANYESEFTQFMREFKNKKPQLEAEQKKGRALLWDKKPIDLDERARAEASRVKQKPYVYSNS